jgi:hypothetical protein
LEKTNDHNPLMVYPENAQTISGRSGVQVLSLSPVI